MKLFEKIRRFIRGADRAVTDAICERLDNTAEKLENFARNLDPEAFQESKMRESWEGRPKTDPETAAQPAQLVGRIAGRCNRPANRRNGEGRIQGR